MAGFKKAAKAEGQTRLDNFFGKPRNNAPSASSKPATRPAAKATAKKGQRAAKPIEVEEEGGETISRMTVEVLRFVA